MTTLLSSEEWQDLMGKALPDEKERLRQDRREGLIEIEGLSETRSARVSRAKQRYEWRRRKRGS
jgi:hypothetical protein